MASAVVTAGEPRPGEDRQAYLGDGVYASFDGFQIWLRTDRIFGTHEIALDAATFSQLAHYALSVWKQP